MKIKLSKSQWEGIGKKAGWMKKANEDYSDMVRVVPPICPSCGESLNEDDFVCPSCDKVFDTWDYRNEN